MPWFLEASDSTELPAGFGGHHGDAINSLMTGFIDYLIHSDSLMGQLIFMPVAYFSKKVNP